MAGIDTLLQENRSFPPISNTTMSPAQHAELVAAWRKDPDTYWANLARQELAWDEPFSKVLDESKAPHFTWFEDGSLNASVNCLDRHLPERKDQTAILWEAEDGEVRDISYGELHDLVCRFAGTLQAEGVRRGDRVIIYMPLVPEVTVAMLACARIGAIHSVVFGGFSAKALADRIEDTGAEVVVTADGAFRAGKVVPLKQNVDEALVQQKQVRRVIVLPRTKQTVPMLEPRDIAWRYDEPVAQAPSMGAEDTLFILYTSGSTGKPKGIVHTTGGYLLWAQLSTRWVFDLQPDDLYWCTADVGWITGHTYLVYGPLLNGARVMMYEGAPMHPNPDRLWDIVARHKVSIFYTAPTAIRALMQKGDDWPAKHDLSSLRILGSVGEPINPEAWMWYHDHIGGGTRPIVDTWWQTETGGIVMSALPGVDTMHPGSCSRPLPGFDLAVLDSDDQPITGSGGELVIQRPWPSMLRGVWRNPARYEEAYWGRFAGKYQAGDTARCDVNGDYWIMGRADDVLNVSGHRIGTMEVESALVSHPGVAEAAVVGIPHAVSGEAIYAFVVLSGEATASALRDHVAKEIGKTARPSGITIAQALPKTRSGKIMRRLLRSIAQGQEITQDISTLEDPQVVARLQEQVRREMAAT